MRRIRIVVDGVVAEAQLYDDKAPKTTQALWDTLPIQDRTIQTRWSGDAWRTEGNYPLLPESEKEGSGRRLARCADRLPKRSPYTATGFAPNRWATSGVISPKSA